MSAIPALAMPLAAGVADAPLMPINKAPAASNPAHAKDLRLSPVISLPFELAPRCRKLAPQLWQCFDRNQKGSRCMAGEPFMQINIETCKQVRQFRWLP
jgi:hypothetical protein